MFLRPFFYNSVYNILIPFHTVGAASSREIVRSKMLLLRWMVIAPAMVLLHYGRSGFQPRNCSQQDAAPTLVGIILSRQDGAPTFVGYRTRDGALTLW